MYSSTGMNLMDSSQEKECEDQKMIQSYVAQKSGKVLNHEILPCYNTHIKKMLSYPTKLTKNYNKKYEGKLGIYTRETSAKTSSRYTVVYVNQSSWELPHKINTAKDVAQFQHVAPLD